MSQFPPAPPMGVPPGAPMYSQPPQKRNNVAAILSLITGILSCIPGLSVLAVILGIVGIKKGNNPSVGGKGMAIAGLVLGVIGLVWTGIALLLLGGGAVLWRAGGPARDAARAFAADVGSGNVDAALKDCSDTVNANKVRATVTEAQAWGPLKDTTLPVFSMNSANGTTTASVSGQATYTNTKKIYTAELVKTGDAYKVSDFTFSGQ